ncbi:structure-specific endonuclease subunit SLX4 [Scaptodrosophila lebanonensis]|uniref:Structure-specific endonuclease subunit SLX4 n=1 Tax=Drosophila lebanonensis TaxID=7225 RepID=A0A6J2TAI5_DROLE|nr:structure-specific endonuclease subunit SLX4 [Scaptodrosophila lebanonensis]
MDRQTRKTNFKKLQLPATTKLRSTRSSKRNTETLTLSNYFNTPEKVSNQADQVEDQSKESEQTATKTNDKIRAANLETSPDEPKIKKPRESDDFEKPGPKPKKAPKIKAKAPRRGRSKQQPAISNFLRNEQLFAEVTAQHCIADNFSPDDIEMALALSKSEAEKHGRLRLHESDDAVVDLIGNTDTEEGNIQNIRLKLQKYGFRTAAKEDYNSLSVAILPGVRRGGKKCRWANKFTALTLRNPEIQLKKLQNRVVTLLAEQWITKEASSEEYSLTSYELISTDLRLLEASDEKRITHEPSEQPLTDLNAYYVRDLFEVSKTPANHLLKDWSAIQGRDLSPKRLTTQSRRRKELLEKVYSELEELFGNKPKPEQKVSSNEMVINNGLPELAKLIKENKVPSLEVENRVKPVVSPKARSLESLEVNESDVRANKQPELAKFFKKNAKALGEESPEINELSNINELSAFAKLIEDNIVEEKSAACATQIEMYQISCSPMNEQPDKRARIGQNEKENISPVTDSLLSIPSQITRCTSPDLFADSDDDGDSMPEVVSREAKEFEDFSLKPYKDDEQEQPHSITTYENYSSDDVKTAVITLPAKKYIKSEEYQFIKNPNEAIIDLSQDSSCSEPENKKANSFFDNDLFDSRPNLEFDEYVEEWKPDYQEVIDFDSRLNVSDNISTISKTYSKSSLHLSSTNCKEDFDSFKIISRMEEKNCSDDFSFTLPNSRQNSDLRIKDSEMTSPTNKTSQDSAKSFAKLDEAAFQLQMSASQSFRISCNQTPNKTKAVEYEHGFKSPVQSSKSNTFNDDSISAFVSPFKHSHSSIDLTQDSNDEAEIETENDGILLSDDEINYSIWKADKTFHTKTINSDIDNCNDIQKKSSFHSAFSFENPVVLSSFHSVDDLHADLMASPTISSKSGNSHSPNKSALSKERAEFGILDAALSQPFTFSQLDSPAKLSDSKEEIDWSDASFLDVIPEVTFKRYSSSHNHKFNELLADVLESEKALKPPSPPPVDLDFDEFDRLVFQTTNDSVTPTASDAFPSGLDRLLKGEINLETLPQPTTPVKQRSPKKSLSVPDQLEVNGQVYKVRVSHSPKPDFIKLSESELLKQLYNYGIKPLKRKQAVKMLEFIYNQTHPKMFVPKIEEPEPTQSIIKKTSLSRSKSTPVGISNNKKQDRLQQTDSLDCLTPTESRAEGKLQLRDAFGDHLLRFSQALPPTLCDDFEYYVLQTNITKKTPQPLVPLHIAWHNLLLANPDLHESILMYEPIDLQEIYMYLKQLGHRYEPKEMKCFFDRRSIIFRYELAPNAKQAERHVRKKPKKPVARY